MKELEAERNELQGTAAKYAEVRLWLDTFIEQTMQSDTLTTVDGTTMKMLVDRIHVRNDGVVVEFKCGVAIEQEYVKRENEPPVGKAQPAGGYHFGVFP